MNNQTNHVAFATSSAENNNGTTQKIKELKKLETKLKQEVDADFFQDPKQFRALPRVIDVLGAQLLDDNNNSYNNSSIPNNVGMNAMSYNLPSESHHMTHFDNLHQNNPAYSSLRKQQEIIEQAIEHLTVNHYSDLNASVVAVGHVSKRFGEAVEQVKDLRKQVQEIRENLVNASVGGGGGNGVASTGDNRGENDDDENEHSESKAAEYYQPHPLGGKSLRELWLKKLECEAVLSLLQKLEVIRKTPSAFDALVHSQPCRIGAAVVLLSDAIDTMFKKDVTQIQALHKITEQLMSRKQKAEEVIWETLQDVIYLRTGNSDLLASQGNGAGVDGAPSSSRNNIDLVMEGSMRSSGADSSGKRGRLVSKRSSGVPVQRRHLFVSTHTTKSGDMSDSDGSDSDMDTKSASTEDRSRKSGGNTNESGNKSSMNKRASNRKSLNSSVLTQVEENTATAFANFTMHEGRLLPRVMVESELDVEVDEIRCLENWKNSQNNIAYSSYSNDATLILPRYTDPVLALRILIEALAKLGRLDDVERIIAENLDSELRRIAQLEQAQTLSKLEKYRSKTGASIHRRSSTSNVGLDATEEKLKIFKSHLRALLKGFGSVMLRLSYLAQILRHRIVSLLSVTFIRQKKIICILIRNYCCLCFY